MNSAYEYLVKNWRKNLKWEKSMSFVMRIKVWLQTLFICSIGESKDVALIKDLCS